MTTDCPTRPDSAAAYRAAQLERHRRLPTAPLVALVEGRGGYAACTGDGQSRTSLARRWAAAQAHGTVTWRTADELAVKVLGLHPLLVWGDDWLDVLRALDEPRPHRSAPAVPSDRLARVLRVCLDEGLVDEAEVRDLELTWA